MEPPLHPWCMEPPPLTTMKTLHPMQAAVNGRLAKSLGRPLRATLASFAGGVAALALAIAACGGPPGGSLHALTHDAPWWAFGGGFLGLLGVTANFVLPKYVGYATYAAFVTFGNLASSLTLDVLGAFGFDVRPPTALRVAGVTLALIGASATRQAARGGAPDANPLLREVQMMASNEPDAVAGAESDAADGRAACTLSCTSTTT